MRSPFTLARFLVCAALLAVPSTGLDAAGKKASAKDEPVAQGAALLRIWKGELPSKRELRIHVKAGRKSTELVKLQSGYQFTEYKNIPTHDVLLEIYESATDGALLATLPLHLRVQGRATLLLSEVDGSLVTEVLDDTSAALRGTNAELAIRNFVPSLATLQISIGDEVKVNLQSPDSSLILRGLKRDVLQVDTAGEQESGKRMRWTNEVDLRSARKATILIYPDPYGRIRPRLIVDGPKGQPEPPRSRAEEQP